MAPRLFAKRPAHSRPASERPGHVSTIVLPFLIIIIALGVLAWRSYVLSARMERGMNRLAMQYAAYAADITARRVDSAVRSELFRASDEWQQVERQSAVGTAALQRWLHGNDWITSAIYIPDADPASAIYVNERAGARHGPRLAREFYTSSGVVRYTYDPARLLDRVQPALARQPLVETRDLSRPAQVVITPSAEPRGPLAVEGGFAYAAPLDAPLSSYAVHAFVATGYGASGWENARFISITLSVVALALTALGALLALHGMRREAETMSLRAALVANVSHELRTPLSMIRLGAETLKRGSRLPEAQRQEIEDSILREVLHLSHLVENVLDVARIQNRSTRALAFTPVYPRDLVTSLVSTYESWIRSKGFELTVTIDDAIEEQSWDREAVSRALLNLIDNGMKYSAEDKRLHVALRQTDENVIIEVRDQGIGIGSTDLSHIFEPYYRARFSDTQTRRGAGLGLTLVHQIVTSHGGRVEVESLQGEGSTFRLLFPRAARTAETVAELTPQTT